MSTVFRSTLIVVSVVTLGVIVAVSVAMDANVSTTALLLALGAAPAIVMALMANGAPTPSVTQIIHAVETRDGRS